MREVDALPCSATQYTPLDTYTEGRLRPPFKCGQYIRRESSGVSVDAADGVCLAAGWRQGRTGRVVTMA
ncbi:hypothetical protein E2C01_024045 [Portunus trituberculatus]|uniref:Uncharacterized protein n=1 Tax=Portunus trituberculatus TaxID=210409 RepID=A0A5B7EC52_PORTR|nr:hypothetical protein [Portunus trituberculatus]